MPNLVSPERPPKYRHHKASGQAVVTISGRAIYLGKYRSPASREAYQRIVGEWLQNGCRLPDAKHDATVTEVIVAYVKFAEGYYRKGGKPTDEVRMIKSALAIVRRLYGRTLASKFGPLSLQAARDQMISEGWCRSHINKQVDRVKRCFKWATGQEMVPGGVYDALRCVAGLKRGRTNAREGRKVQSVSDSDFQATLPYMPPAVRAMAQLQRLTGARPGEICDLRPSDVNRGANPWEYAPSTHKTEHHDRPRVIFIGAKGQDVLLPFLLRPSDSYCFVPRESEAKRRAAAHDARTTPLKYGNRPGTNRIRRAKRIAGEKYTKDSYGKAVRRAAKKAGVPSWSPNQLRHSFATEVRRTYGIEAAQVCLGHSKANTTEIYAERDFARAAAVAGEIG